MADAEKTYWGYRVTVAGSGGKTVLNVANSGRVEDVSDAAVTKSDINIVCSVIPRDLAEKVRAWWQGHIGG